MHRTTSPLLRVAGGCAVGGSATRWGVGCTSEGAGCEEVFGTCEFDVW